MHTMFAYELAEIVHEERLAEARRERLARSVQPKRNRRQSWVRHQRSAQVAPLGETARSCVVCPSPSV